MVEVNQAIAANAAKNVDGFDESDSNISDPPLTVEVAAIQGKLDDLIKRHIVLEIEAPDCNHADYGLPHSGVDHFSDPCRSFLYGQAEWAGNLVPDGIGRC